MDYKRVYDRLVLSGKESRFEFSHKHHIIPRHVGGTNDRENLVFLTVRQHALAHRLLWKIYHRWQDRLAWQSLSGLIESTEVAFQVSRLARIGLFGSKHGKYKGAVVGVNILDGSSIRLEGRTAQEAAGFMQTKISACINGRAKTHKGYTWTREIA